MLALWLAMAMVVGFPQQAPESSPQSPSVNEAQPLHISPEQEKMMREAREEAERQRQDAIRINELAGHVQSEADARRYVDEIAKMFSDQMAYWVTGPIRARIARAEYATVSDRNQLIPEQRIADAFNRLADDLGAPVEVHVNAAEIHNMRDAQYSTAQVMWMHANQSVWTMPNVYALGPDGKVADGCRAVDAIHTLYMLHNMYGNLIAARERLKKGVVFSDRMQAERDHPQPRAVYTTRLSAGPLRSDPVVEALHAAEARYLQERGPREYERRLKEMFDRVMP